LDKFKRLTKPDLLLIDQAKKDDLFEKIRGGFYAIRTTCYYCSHVDFKLCSYKTVKLRGVIVMNKKPVTKAEVIKLINLGIVVKNDTSDGYVTIKRKIKGIFEIKVYTNGVAKPEVFNNNFENLLNTMNKYDGFYIEEE
jgi:hypothetical protein